MYFKPKVNNALKVITHLASLPRHERCVTQDIVIALNMNTTSVELALSSLHKLGVTDVKRGPGGGTKLIDNKLMSTSLHDVYNACYPTNKEGYGIFVTWNIANFLES